MWRKLKTVLLCLIICPFVLAEIGNLELKLLNGGSKGVDAGSSINVLIMINNRADTDKEIQIGLVNGGRWKLIADYSSIRIEKKSGVHKIIGIQIPGNQMAGDFTIELEAIEKPGMTTFGKIEIPIQVKPRYEISVIKLRTPPYLFSGDTLNIGYLIQNQSNLEVSVNTTVLCGSQVKKNQLQIQKDSSTIYRFHVETPKGNAMPMQQSIIMTAVVTDKPETEKSAYTSFDIFPTGKVKFDKYERFPVKVTGIAAATNRYAQQIYSSMFDVQGQGTIGNKNEKTLDFRLRGPDRTGNPLFGLNDEYYLKYTAKKLELALGDCNYSLSEMTESSRNGRGLKLQYNLKKWSIGSYYNSPRYYPLIKKIYAAYSGFTFNPKNELLVGVLSKTDTINQRTQLYTLSAVNSPLPWVKTDVELALGQNLSGLTKAYKGLLQLNLPHLSSNLNYLYAEPEFPGFVSNSLRINSGISLQLKKLTLSASYDENSTNLALDTLYSNMPFSKNMSLTGSFRFSANNSVSLGVYTMSTKDKSPTPMFDYTKYNGSMGIQSRIGSFNLALQLDYGKMRNQLGMNGNELSINYNGNLSMYYVFNPKLTASAYTSYQGGQQMVTGYDRIYYGGTLMGSIRDRYSVSFQYNSNYEWRYYTSDRSLLSLNLNGRINPRNELSLMVSYNLMKNTLDTKEYNVQLRYTYTINLPISKKKDVGSVSGKIIDHGLNKVGGIRLNLNGIVTITDKDGNYKFPVVPVGSYVLNIDASSSGLNATTEIPGPFVIKVEPGKVTPFDFAMTKSGRIQGRLVVQEDERTGQKGYIPVKENIGKLIVEVNNGTEVFRMYTDQNGGFSFEDLRPGNWQVKIYPNGLPQGYQLVTSLFNMALTSGEDKKMEIPVNKKARQIQFQKTFK